MGYDDRYDDNYNAFAQLTLGRHVANLHRQVQDYYNQIGIHLTIANEGAVQAENLVVELRCTGGGLRERFLVHWLFGPPPPKLKDPTSSLFVRGLNFDHRDIPIVRGRHDVFFETSPEGEDVAEIHCADFRHGWTWEWDGIGHLDGTLDVFTVTVTLTASNMRGRRIQTFTLPTISTTSRVMTLIDPVEQSYKASFPLQERFERAVRDHDKEWLKFPEHDDD